MRLAHCLFLTLCLCALSSLDVQAQTPPAEKELGVLKGYTAPKMFARSKPAVVPQVSTTETPAPAKVDTPIAVPAPVAPIQQTPPPAPLPVPVVATTPPTASVLPAPIPPQAVFPVTAEQLLNFPTTGGAQSPMTVTNPVQSAAIPAPPVDNGLPLPGSVAPTPAKTPPVQETVKPSPVKAPTKKYAPKKPEPKKAETKKEDVKKVSEKKPEKIEVKEKPALVTKKEAAVKTLPLPAQAKIEPLNLKPVVELPKPKEITPYRLDGKKNMPSIKQSKIDKENLGSKSPLPDIAAAPPAVALTKSEKIIDQALEKNLVQPSKK